MPDSNRKLPYHLRAHSLPEFLRKDFRRAMLWSSVFYYSLICTLTSAFAYFLIVQKKQAFLMMGFTILTILLWVCSLIARKIARCPLCKGTPYFDNGAMRHGKSFRLFPLNCGHSNLLASLIARRFRCQYCGTPFDLLKPNFLSEGPGGNHAESSKIPSCQAPAHTLASRPPNPGSHHVQA